MQIITVKTLLYTEKNGIKLLHMQTKSAAIYVHTDKQYEP